MNLFSSHRLHAVLVRFTLSGGLATLLHWALMTLLVLAHCNANAATAVGALAGAAANYGLQQRFTFRLQGGHGRALPRYGLAVALGWLANLGLFAGLHEGLALTVAVAQFMTSALVALLNFFLYKRWVFHDSLHSGITL